jgi:hypothetical protein
VLLSITPAGQPDLRWAQAMVAQHHYLKKPVDARSRPLAYVVHLEGWFVYRSLPVGCLIFGRPQASCCYEGQLKYGSAADVERGRARLDRWSVLNLARVWLHPIVQAGGEACRPGFVPGFTDRRGTWRTAAASWAVRQALARVGHDYLLAYPPVWVEEPYQIRAVLSYCDPDRHKGTLYRAAGFRLARTNEDGVQTWWTEEVAGLTAAQDAAVRRLAAADPRGAAIRGRRRDEPTLFGGRG